MHGDYKNTVFPFFYKKNTVVVRVFHFYLPRLSIVPQFRPGTNEEILSENIIRKK